MSGKLSPKATALAMRRGSDRGTSPLGTRTLEISREPLETAQHLGMARGRGAPIHSDRSASTRAEGRAARIVPPARSLDAASARH